MVDLGFPGDLVVKTNKQQQQQQQQKKKHLPANTGDTGLVPRLGRSPGEGNGNPLQYSCLENSMDRRALQVTVLGVPKS